MTSVEVIFGGLKLGQPETKERAGGGGGKKEKNNRCFSLLLRFSFLSLCLFLCFCITDNTNNSRYRSQRRLLVCVWVF